MATLDGFQAYPCGMTAQHAVEALWKAHGITETLKGYTKIIESNDPPSIAEFTSNGIMLWWNMSNYKLYKGFKNPYLHLLVWFEV